MKTDLEHNINKIKYIEKSVSGIGYSIALKKYIHPENYLWIKRVQWPFESYKLLSKVSGISAFPEKRLKYWLLVIKNKGKGIKKRMGVFLKIPFESIASLPINADVYFNKDCFGILLYINQKQPKVIKFNQQADIDSFNKIKNEAISLESVNKIQHKTVKTPTLLKMQTEGDLCFFEQELIFAKDLHFLSKKEQDKIFNEVFEFMFLLYKESGVKLMTVKNEETAVANAVLNYLNGLENGKKILEKYYALIAEGKKVLVGKVHGDLYLNNILTNKQKSTFWIIDWGESNVDYLVKDFKNNVTCAASHYIKIVDFFNFNKSQLYSIEEQIFLAEYNTITSLITNYSIKKKPDSYFSYDLFCFFIN